MEISETKKQLLTYIDLIEDANQLEMLCEAAEAYATKQPDIPDLLTPEQLKRLKESIQQADEGKVLSHDEVMKLSEEWINKAVK